MIAVVRGLTSDQATSTIRGAHPRKDPVPNLVTLENGLRVLVIPVPHARSVSVSAYVAAGARFEALPEEAGLSHFVEHLCFKGTERRPRPQDISAEIDSLGGAMNAATDREYTVYYSKVIRQHAEQTLDVIGDILRNSLYLPAEIERERGVIIEELAAVEDSPDEQAGVLLDQLLWPDQPHGRDIAGSKETVGAISHERLIAYYRQQYVPNATVISQFGDWQPGTPLDWKRNVHVHGPRAQVIAKDTEQAHLTLGLLSMSANDPRKYPLTLLSIIVGEGMSSRLFTRLREELGLCYDIHTSLTQLLDTGSFGVYAGVDPTNALEAMREIGSELRAAREPVSAVELERAKSLIRSRIELSVEDTRSVSGWYGGRAIRGLALETPEEVTARFEAVTIDEITEVAREVIRDEHLRFAAVGPFESVDPLFEAVRLDA
jgi:predicted Zn-dependent peptidase